MKKWTASVVGGGAGGKLSMKALHNSGRFELVAAADLKPEIRNQLQEFFPGIKTYTNHKEMFADSPTDIVCVSTFPPSHEEVTMDALQLPLKGILVEKPIGHTAVSGRRILEAIKARNLPMAVPHGLLAKRTPLEVIRLVRKGDIGELKLVEIQNDKWDIINAGIHWLNFFVNLVDNEPMDSVMAVCDAGTRTYRDGMQVETVAVTYGVTKNGIRVVMNTGDFVHVNREGKNTLFRLVGDRGIIEFWGWENGYYLLNMKHPGGTTVVPEEFPVIGHQWHLEHMASMIDTGRTDYSIPESSLTALEVVEAAYLSGRYQCKVTFPLTAFSVPERTDWEPGQPYSGTGGGRDGRQL